MTIFDRSSANEIPPPLRYGLVETVVSKLRRGLPAGAPTVLTYADGNFAAGLATAGSLIVSALTWVIYEIPALSFIPPEQIVQGATAGIPTPDPRSLMPEDRALTARGQYLFTVASCAFCHGTDGRGGLKVNWRPFGTLWVRNITPDRDTDIFAKSRRSGTQFHRLVHPPSMTVRPIRSGSPRRRLRVAATATRACPSISRTP